MSLESVSLDGQFDNGSSSGVPRGQKEGATTPLRPTFAFKDTIIDQWCSDCTTNTWVILLGNVMEIKLLFLLWALCIIGSIWVLINGVDDDA